MGNYKKIVVESKNVATKKNKKSTLNTKVESKKATSAKDVKSINKEQILSANFNVSKKISPRGSRLLDISTLTTVEKRKYTKLKTSIESLYNERRRIEKELKNIFSKDEFAKKVYEDIQRNSYYSTNNERRRNLKK